jgi:DNA polymerase
MAEREVFIEWYIENNIYDVIDEIPFNHFVNVKDSSSFTIYDNNSNSKLSSKISSVVKKDVSINNGNLENISFSRKLADESNTLIELKNNLNNLKGLDALKTVATNTVFNDGDEHSNIFILGEAPGEEEDIAGIPFCGQSGKLLNEFFKSIGYTRDKLYITNTLFWRPPANRTPTDNEIAICQPFVERQISLVNPKLIICMGATAFYSLIKTNLKITGARQKTYTYQNKYITNSINVIPTFHPSYILRNSYKKKEVWHDLIFIRNKLE